MPPLKPEGWHFPLRSTVPRTTKGRMAWQWRDGGLPKKDSVLLVWHSDYPGITFNIKWGMSNAEIEAEGRWILLEDRIHAKMGKNGIKPATDAATTEKEGTEDAP